MPAQAKKVGDTFTFTPSYIVKRTEIGEADGGGQSVELGLSRTDIARLGIHRVRVDRGPDEPPIERHQSLNVTVTDISVQNWTRVQAVIIDGTAEFIQYVPKYSTRVDGISFSDCRNLNDRFGKSFPALIAADPGLLATKTRYSKEKREVITRACKREMKARKKDDADTADLLAKLNACGVTKAKARRLAENYDPEKSPYQFFFRRPAGFSFL